MPLLYQGRLDQGRVRTPKAGLEAGERVLEATTHDRRIDLRLVWDAPEPFARCAPHLPDDFAGYWIDIAAEIDARQIDELEAWARTLTGGTLGLACIVPGRENEVTCTLPGPSPVRMDAERLDPFRKHLHDTRITVNYAETGALTAPSQARRAVAAERVRAAFDVLSDAVADPLPTYRDVMTEDPRVPPAAVSWLEGSGTAADRQWFPPRPIPPVSRADTDLKPRIVDGTPFGLQFTVPPDAGETRVGLWRRWAGLLDRLDLVLLRCMGRLDAIEALLDRFDLHHRHPHRPHQTFGICTVHHPTAIGVDAARSIVAAPVVNDALLDWGIRWSGITLALDGHLDQRGKTGRSFYVIRTERRRTYDSLHLALDTEDPESRALRNARRQMVGRFGAMVEQGSAWQYVGPAPDTPIGRRYQQLRAALLPIAAEVVDGAEPVPPETPAAPGVFGRLMERVLRRGDGPFELVPAFEQALATALPGFRHDRRAHLTTRYFVEFVRHSKAGVHIVLLQRLHGPAGFRISVGVSLVPLQLADLDPGRGRTAPGLAVPLTDLVPERAHLDWTYGGRPSAERAIADAIGLLAARAEPFFTAAERALAAHAAPAEEV